MIKIGLSTLLVGAISCSLAACSTPSASTKPARESIKASTRVGAITRSEFPAQLTARAISVSGPEDAGAIEIYVER